MKRKVFPLWIFFFFCGPYFFFFWHILKWYRNLFIGMGWGEGCVFFYFSCVMYCATSISSRRTHKVYYQRNICQRARMCVCVCISFLLAGLTRVSLLLFSFFFFLNFYFLLCVHNRLSSPWQPFFFELLSLALISLPFVSVGGWGGIVKEDVYMKRCGKKKKETIAERKQIAKLGGTSK